MMPIQTRESTAKEAPQGSYVVLRVPDLERSANFYRALGLELTEEKHGEGPVHYSFPLAADVVCELYPLRAGSLAPVPGIRLGFAVLNPDAVRAELARSGYSVSDGHTPGAFVVVDPSGTQVEIAPRAA
jgi:catechol 2,3-dioxygenase-like lactoylglutathione lyase family enzyme